MPESIRRGELKHGERKSRNQVEERVRDAGDALTALLREAEEARQLRTERPGGDGAEAVCAWNHFENIPTFYNWNNRPR